VHVVGEVRHDDAHSKRRAEHEERTAWCAVRLPSVEFLEHAGQTCDSPGAAGRPADQGTAHGGHG